MDPQNSSQAAKFSKGISMYLILAGFMILCVFLNLKFSSKNGNSIWSDKEGYYMYLPAVFIYHGFENYPVKTKKVFLKYPQTNKTFTKYTCGVAMLQLPFFLIAHLYCTAFTHSADGLNNIYASLIDFSAIFYVSFAFMLLYDFLKKTYKKGIILAAFASIFFGTNLYMYTLDQGIMSHSYNFFLLSLLLWFSPRFYANPGKLNFLFLGLISGIIILIRPTNILMLVFFLLYDVSDKEGLQKRITFFLKNWPALLITLLFAIIVFAPQLAYWYYLSGDLIIYSYNKEGFIYWSRPRIGKVLFAPWNGWILYSPIVVFPLAGILLAIKNKIKNSLQTLILLMIATYIFASWWAWWFGSAFGHRCFIDYYPLLIIFLCYFFQQMRNRKLSYRVFISLALIICCYQNIAMTYLFIKTAPWDGKSFNMYSYVNIQRKIFFIQ